MRALIIDSDFRQKSDLPENNAYIFAENIGEAKFHLRNVRQRYNGIFLNPNISITEGASLIRLAHEFQVGTPIYFIADNDSILSSKTLSKMGVMKSILKPLTTQKIEDCVGTKDVPSKTVTLSKEAADGLYRSVSILGFLDEHVSAFDLFVKAENDRYLKVLNCGENFSRERLKGYLDKGAESFFIKKSDQQSYVSYCDMITSLILQKKSVKFDQKRTRVFYAAEEFLGLFASKGLSERNLSYALNFVLYVDDLVKEINLESNENIKNTLNDVSAYDHAIGVTLVTALILKTMGYESQRIKKIAGLSAFLHDIGLHWSDRVIEEKYPWQMSEQERLIYFEHPERGAKILEHISGIDPLIVDVVRYHHCRRNNQGFPRQSTGKFQNTIQEIVGLSDEFVRLIQFATQKKGLDPYREIKYWAFDGFSFQTIEAFCRTFQLTY